MPGAEKLAVVLFNLGGPSEKAAIRPFLFNFFMDKNIISLPQPLRWGLAQWISQTRSRSAAKKAYAPLGGKSPLLENTKKQASALEEVLKQDGVNTRVFVSMRYWHPFAAETARHVAAFGPDKIILLPLYPQYSTTTTFSSLQNWKKEAKTAGIAAETYAVCCYPEEQSFIDASAELIKQRAPEKTRLLFSAHGLPEKFIRAGDPYQKHCERTAAAIASKLGAQDWLLCYQSRIGRLKWIGPSIEEALEAAAKDKVGVTVYPLSFVSEHVETLVELDMEYAGRAEKLGLPHYVRVPTVSTHPVFIDGLKRLVLAAADGIECGQEKEPCAARCYRREKNV